MFSTPKRLAFSRCLWESIDPQTVSDVVCITLGDTSTTGHIGSLGPSVQTILSRPGLVCSRSCRAFQSPPVVWASNVLRRPHLLGIQTTFTISCLGFFKKLEFLLGSETEMSSKGKCLWYWWLKIYQRKCYSWFFSNQCTVQSIDSV